LAARRGALHDRRHAFVSTTPTVRRRRPRRHPHGRAV